MIGVFVKFVEIRVAHQIYVYWNPFITCHYIILQNVYICSILMVFLWFRLLHNDAQEAGHHFPPHSPEVRPLPFAGLTPLIHRLPSIPPRTAVLPPFPPPLPHRPPRRHPRQMLTRKALRNRFLNHSHFIPFFIFCFRCTRIIKLFLTFHWVVIGWIVFWEKSPRNQSQCFLSFF